MFKNKLSLILSSIVILLPCILGLLSENGSLLIIPFILLVFQWVCVFITLKDPRNKEQSQKVMGMVIWMVPVISVFCSLMMFFVAKGRPLSAPIGASVLLSGVFIAIGNYLPKCKRNSTIGIKIKRTLESDSNWQATHRFAGKLWVICGVLMLFTAFLDHYWFIGAILGIIALAVIPPLVYSHIFYKRELKNGTYSLDNTHLLFVSKKAKIVVWIFLALLLVFIAVLMFTGNIVIEYNESEITLEGTYWSDARIKIEEIESIEFTENSPAYKFNGFNSYKVSLGGFQNEELGNHERYCYNQCDKAIVIYTEKDVYLFNLETESETKALYEQILKLVK